MESPNRNIREKRHRLPRTAYRGAVTVSITACILKNEPLFQIAEVVEHFTSCLRRAVEKRRCLVLVYCFMPEHLHLILQGREEQADTWQAMVDFKQQTGFWLAQHRSSIAWQKDFYDHIIRGGEDLGSQVRYIANNPVRRKLVLRWDEYPYTGAIGIDLKTVMADAATL